MIDTDVDVGINKYRCTYRYDTDVDADVLADVNRL